MFRDDVARKIRDDMVARDEGSCSPTLDMFEISCCSRMHNVRARHPMRHLFVVSCGSRQHNVARVHVRVSEKIERVLQTRLHDFSLMPVDLHSFHHVWFWYRQTQTTCCIQCRIPVPYQWRTAGCVFCYIKSWKASHSKHKLAYLHLSDICAQKFSTLCLCFNHW